MTTDKITSLPWKALGWGSTKQIFINSVNGVVCRIVNTVSGKPITGEDNANANFIVTACNSHTALLDALKGLESKVSNKGLFPVMDEELIKARKVIKAAEEIK